MSNFWKFRFIQSQILVSASILGLFTISILIAWSTIKIRAVSLESSIESSKSANLKVSSEFQTEINNPLIITKNLADAYAGVRSKEQNSRKQLTSMLHSILASNKQLLGVYTCWEENAFDGRDEDYIGEDYHDTSGRFIPYIVYNKGKIIQEELVGYETDNEQSVWYYIPKKSGKISVVEPFQYPIDGKDTWMMSLVAPVMVNNTFRGMFGVDLALDSMQNRMKSKTLLEGEGGIYMISENGFIVASSDEEHHNGSRIDEEFQSLVPKIVDAAAFSSYLLNDTLYTINPIYFHQYDKPWYVVTSLPKAAVMRAANENLILMLLAGLAILFVFVVVLYMTVRKFVTPIRKITEAAQQVSKGETKTWNIQSYSVETDMLIAAFEEVVNKRKHITEVCTSIADGNLNAEAEVGSERDELSKAVNKMIQNLRIANMREEQRNWINQGLAEFAELLRESHDMKQLGDALVSKLANYAKLNQVGFFLVQTKDEYSYLELISCYAWDRAKMLQKTIEVGEGLVGQCYCEKESILMTDLPKNYINITSGLGQANPSCLLIMPLKVNDEVEGIIEIASFHKLETYQIEFFEKLAESIASTIRSLRITQETRLLLEESKQQTEELRAQEEEMRQNMEEMQATQEEIVRKEAEIQRLLQESQCQAQEIALKNEKLEEVRLVEKKRGEQQIEAQKKLMEKFMLKSKAKEEELLNKIKELQNK